MVWPAPQKVEWLTLQGEESKSNSSKKKQLLNKSRTSAANELQRVLALMQEFALVLEFREKVSLIKPHILQREELKLRLGSEPKEHQAMLKEKALEELKPDMEVLRVVLTQVHIRKGMLEKVQASLVKEQRKALNFKLRVPEKELVVEQPQLKSTQQK